MKKLLLISIIALTAAVPAFGQEAGRTGGSETDDGSGIPVINAGELEAASVVASPEPISVKGDTVVYNAAAYRVGEDAALDELLRKIPGIDVDASGVVTLHGRKVRELLVNGRRFFGGDVRMALRSIPANMIDNMQAYDRPSDQARLSGVEDGEEEPVLDLSIKKSMMDSWKLTSQAGAGTKDRYSLKANANSISDRSNKTVAADFHNTSGKVSVTTTNRTQVGTGSAGNARYGQAGASFSEEKNGIELEGSLNFKSTGRNVTSRSRSENVYASGSTFANSNGIREYYAPEVNGNFSLENKKNKYGSLLIRSEFRYENSANRSYTEGRSFKSNPYSIEPDPNEWMGFDIAGDPFSSIRINSTRNTSGTFNSRLSGKISASYTIRSKSKKGRSLSFRIFTQGWTAANDQFSNYLTRYYRISKNPDSLLVRSSYLDNDSRMGNLYGQVSFNNPLGKGWSLQSWFRLDYTYHSQDKSYYDIASADPAWTLAEGLSLSSAKRCLPDGWQAGRVALFSAEADYGRTIGTLQVNFVKHSRKYNLTLGGTLRTQMSLLECKGEDVRRSATDAAPNLVFRYRFNKTKQLSFNYRTWVNSAPVNSMLPITNGSNPLYVSVGNPRLLSPLVHNANLTYNYSNPKKQDSFVGSLVYTNTRRAVSNSTVYDETSGVRTSTPRNINGNWRVTGSAVLNHSLKDRRWSVSNQTGAEMQNNTSYLYNNRKREDETNVVRRFMAKDRFEGRFHGTRLELALNGGLEYTAERSLLRPEMDQNPLSYIAGASTLFAFPWGFRFESDITTIFQRGWTWNELNKDYHIWNAELVKRMAGGRATLRLCWYDILGSQDNLTRTIGATTRSVILYNGVSSYVMLRFFYRFR